MTCDVLGTATEIRIKTVDCYSEQTVGQKTLHELLQQ